MLEWVGGKIGRKTGVRIEIWRERKVYKYPLATIVFPVTVIIKTLDNKLQNNF